MHNHTAALYTTTPSSKLRTPPPLPPRHRRRRCCCCWCNLRVFVKNSNRLSVVLLLEIVHLAEPVCAPARWLLLAPLLSCRTSLLGHRRLRLHRCCRCCCCSHSLLRVSRKCAAVFIVVLSNAVRAFLTLFHVSHTVSCMFMYKTCIDRRHPKDVDSVEDDIFRLFFVLLFVLQISQTQPN